MNRIYACLGLRNQRERQGSAMQGLKPYPGTFKPYPGTRWGKRAFIVSLATTALSLSSAAAAVAAPVELAPCDDAPLSKPFAAWGDIAHYKLAPQGDFEASISDWTVTGGAVKASDNEPWYVTGKAGHKALELRSGVSATSPATCVNAGAPTFRFFARSRGLLPALLVDALYRDSELGMVSVPVGVVTPNSSWSPTLPMLTGSALPAATEDGQASMQLRFTALSGDWRIDEVFIDPYSRG
jgi:hypothetical protein